MKNLDTLNVILSDGSGNTTEYSARVVMSTQGTTDEVSSKKQHTVTRVLLESIVNSNVITIDSSHKLLNGETVRIQSDTEKF